MQESHRRAQIIDALEALLIQLKDTTDVSGFPIQIKTVQKRFIEWTTLDKQGAIPALKLDYGLQMRPIEGGSSAKYAAVGEIEEPYPFTVTAILKETSETDAIPDQVADIHYSIERLINGTRDLAVEGVVNTEIDRVMNYNRMRNLPPNSKFQIILFEIIVTHVYSATTSV